MNTIFSEQEPLQPAIRGQATLYYSDGRKRCQQSLGRVNKHKGATSYTSFRITGNGSVHNTYAIRFFFHFQRPQADREFTGNSDNGFFLAPRVASDSAVFGKQYRVFPYGTPRTFDQPRSHIFGTLTRNPAPVHCLARREFSAGETGEGCDVLARWEPPHLTPLEGQSDYRYSRPPQADRAARNPGIPLHTAP